MYSLRGADAGRSHSVSRIGLAPNVKHEVVRQMDTLRRSLTSMKPKVVSWTVGRDHRSQTL